jgi:hypothetical protein
MFGHAPSGPVGNEALISAKFQKLFLPGYGQDLVPITVFIGSNRQGVRQLLESQDTGCFRLEPIPAPTEG